MNGLTPKVATVTAATATATAAAELDVFSCALDGVNQIEASAGTGKTWNICALYVRLLLEKRLDTGQILVVTFTKAATAELHERIRARLAQLLSALERDAPQGDPFLESLFKTTLAPGSGLEREQARKRVKSALGTFDQAAIHTIHAFCQRALQEAPFAAAMPFVFEMEADDAVLRFELAADFWREQVEPVAAAHPAFAAWLVAKRAGPAALDMQLVRRLKKPLAQLRWGFIGQPAEAAHAEPQAVFSALRERWLAQQDEITHLLAAAEARLSRTSHKPEVIRAALAAWESYLAPEASFAAPPRIALKLTASALAKATKVRQAPPVHSFFMLADELAAATLAADEAQQRRWLQLIQRWLDDAPAELAARKRARRVVSFDDLLSNLFQALAAHPWLAETLRTRYPAALIDEFQDTDPLQFSIFNRIFAPAGPLFLVGDPKQAIYSFRAADLHTYLAARAAASARYTLAINQRSSAPLVEACNRIFSANPHAFVFDGLNYQPVRAGERQRVALSDSAAPGAQPVEGLRVWRLAEGDAVLTKREAQRAASQACAAEIVRLLRGAREGTVRLGETPLAPGQIAVLVQTHRQGSQIKRSLAEWGVGSVELAQASVFATPDAEQIERVLNAVETPGDLRRLRAALATDWIGLSATALWQQQASETQDLTEEGEGGTPGPRAGHAGTGPESTESTGSTDAMVWVERFSRYRLLWLERGFAVMWRVLMRELGIARQLAAGPDGERRLTNASHLAELLQARAAAQPGIAPTLRWLAVQRVQGGGEEAQLRLESDRNLVQIVTVHKAKGLEYAVVFCPFLNDGALREPTASGLPDAREYHDETGQAILHYGCDDEQAEHALTMARREQAAERARLVYVALTRAVYRCYLVSGPYLVSRSNRESRRSVLNWLVAGRGQAFDDWLAEPPDENMLTQCWHDLTQGSAPGPVTLEALPVPAQCVPLEPLQSGAEAIEAQVSQRFVRETWRMASFSAMIAAGARMGAMPMSQHETESLPDHDQTAASLAAGLAPVLPWPLDATAQARAADDILAFPRGPAAGECLHKMFELADFSAPQTWPQVIQRALRERPVSAPAALAQRLPTMMQTLLADVSATELVPGMTLAGLDHGRRLNELAFLFPAPALDFTVLRTRLAEAGYPDVLLEAGVLHGFIKGFIDMIVEHDGRFWIIDWKSNYLGETAEAYAAASLEAAMAQHAYHLQALLYTVALHRYLKTRVRNYAYETHIGGYLYLFVRGVRPAWRHAGTAAGVHARCPDAVLVNWLDQLMEGAIS
ncbi:exodeoxyribonuclease V subunit beta [Paraburkholderia hayleyella]|uniref:exodeoxyribonuclease V subunit beta n=1 Tax=Paraburkholderia hayleyella TaxID=2152889 RepID=UPI00129271BE|nr:exodeoxyribonuclease V subunit beta [Paraburkholderia hayleyella]